MASVGVISGAPGPRGPVLSSLHFRSFAAAVRTLLGGTRNASAVQSTSSASFATTIDLVARGFETKSQNTFKGESPAVAQEASRAP